MVSRLRPVLAAVLALLFFAASPALAHDELISTDPADGASLDVAPDELTLTFSGEIAQVGAQVEVTGGPGGTLTDGAPQVEGTEVVQKLADLPGGDYEVLWRVTSQDGHPISGDFSFTVAQGQEEAGAGAEETTTEDAEESATQTSEAPASTEASETSAGESSAPQTTQPETTVTPENGDESGFPTWAWLLIGAAVLALLGAAAAAATRRRA